MRKNIFLYIAPIILSGCIPQNKTENNYHYDLPEITHHNYYEVEEFMITWNKIFDINISLYFVYFYSPSCNHCSDLKDWIITEALEREDIYFVKASEKDVISNDVSKSIGATSVDNLVIMGYPSMVEISNGKIVKNCAGKTNIQDMLSSQ